MGYIGYFIKEGEIEESGVCKRGTANKVITGRNYYKMVRCHSLVSEGMVGLAWDAFEKWLLAGGRHEILEFGDSLGDLHEALKTKDAQAALPSCVCLMSALQDICPKWRVCCITGKNCKILVDVGGNSEHPETTHQSREIRRLTRKPQGDSKHATIHRGGKAYITLYFKDMKELCEKHPVVCDNFMRGNFIVHRTQGRFNGSWTDMPLAQTYKKEGKTSLPKKITQSPAAHEKYFKTAPFLTKISESVKDMELLRHTASHH